MTQTQIFGSSNTPSATELPTAFGKYRVLSLLGSGGFGAVYRCRDDALGRDVAVKALSPQLQQDEDIRARFIREARALASVSHPAVVQIFDVGEVETGPFFVMELVAGRDLEHIAREQAPMAETRVLSLVRQAVCGLQAANAAGVVHRDIKPANLLVSGTPPGEMVKVTDFGLAFPGATEGNRLTAPTTILGTPEYMAPEQARGTAVDARADMYSLGCTLYELLVGTPPFVTPSPQSTVASQLTQTPEPPRVRRPDLSVATNALIMRLLAKEPDGRFKSYEEMLQGIDAAIAATPAPSTSSAGLSVVLPPPPAPSQVSSRSEAVITENLALCFVDLVDFQERTRQQTREENAEWTGDFSDGMKRLVRSRGGRFIKQVYGQVLCSFVSPTDAVLFGMAVVDAAWEWSRGKPDVMTYAMRVGINLGEVRVERGDVFGDPVNVAARVMSLSEPGQVLFSDAIYLAMSRSEVQAEFIGHRELKGVPVPVRIYKALPVPGHVAGPKAPPFGVKASGGGAEALEALEKLDKGARAAMGAAADGAIKAGAVVAPAVQVAKGLAARLWDLVPSEHRRKVALGVPAAALLLTAAVLVPQWMDPYRKEIALLDDGKAGAAARALELRASENPRANWLYAKALMLSGKRSEALEQFDEALSRDPSFADDETLELVLRGFNERDKSAPRLVVKHYGPKAKDTLQEQTESQRYYVRHHAADALLEMGHGDVVDWVALWLKDIRLENNCSRRRDAVRELERIGDERALAAVQSARTDPGGDAGCVGEHLSAVERRLKAKLGKGGG